MQLTLKTTFHTNFHQLLSSKQTEPYRTFDLYLNYLVMVKSLHMLSKENVYHGSLVTISYFYVLEWVDHILVCHRKYWWMFDSNHNVLWVQKYTYSIQFLSQLPAFDGHQQASGRLLAEFLTTSIKSICEVQLNRLFGQHSSHALNGVRVTTWEDHSKTSILFYN